MPVLLCIFCEERPVTVTAKGDVVEYGMWCEVCDGDPKFLRQTPTIKGLIAILEHECPKPPFVFGFYLNYKRQSIYHAKRFEWRADNVREGWAVQYFRADDVAERMPFSRWPAEFLDKFRYLTLTEVANHPTKP